MNHIWVVENLKVYSHPTPSSQAIGNFLFTVLQESANTYGKDESVKA